MIDSHLFLLHIQFTSSLTSSFFTPFAFCPLQLFDLIAFFLFFSSPYLLYHHLNHFMQQHPPSDTLVITAYTTAASALQALSPFFHSQEINSHIIYSFIHTQLARDQQLSSTASASASSHGPNPQQPGAAPSLWVAVWTMDSKSHARFLDLVVALPTSPLGPNPLFIVSPHPSAMLSPNFLRPRLSLLVSELLGRGPVERVFSVFGPRRLTQAFVATWSRAAHVSLADSPYSSVTYRVCCRETLARVVAPVPAGDVLRLATMHDVNTAAELLYNLSIESGPYAVTRQTAHQEAVSLFASRALYVYESRTGSGPTITALAAVGRTSQNVACVTRLFTTPRYRRHGISTSLLRFVCQSLLLQRQKTAVVLYLPDGNDAAERVVGRVGFVDVPSEGGLRGERDWLEQGFQDMELGYW